jgi:hypothetical protein
VYKCQNIYYSTKGCTTYSGNIISEWNSQPPLVSVLYHGSLISAANFSEDIYTPKGTKNSLDMEVLAAGRFASQGTGLDSS